MYRKLILLAIVLAMVSCGDKGITLGKTEVVVYESLGNGVANISLKLYENNTFLFKLNSISQPETNDEPIVVSEIGTYTSEGNWKHLNFKNQKFSLEAIFDNQFSESNEFQVIDDSTVKINTAKQVIPIWGVICKRK